MQQICLTFFICRVVVIYYMCSVSKMQQGITLGVLMVRQGAVPGAESASSKT